MNFVDNQNDAPANQNVNLECPICGNTEIEGNGFCTCEFCEFEAEQSIFERAAEENEPDFERDRYDI